MFLTLKTLPTPTYFRTSVLFQVFFFFVLLLKSFLFLQAFQSTSEASQSHKERFMG